MQPDLFLSSGPVENAASPEVGAAASVPPPFLFFSFRFPFDAHLLLPSAAMVLSFPSPWIEVGEEVLR